MAGRGGSDGGGFVAVFLVLLGISLVVKYIWWFVAAAALVGLFFAGRALARHLEKRRELAEEEEFALRRRADRQHRWMLSGDSRAVYGPEGAGAMRALSPDEDDDGRPLAAIARTDGEIAALVRDKPPCWEQALFASVLLQRQAPLQSYREFITEYVEIVESLPRIFQHASGTVHLGAVVLDIDFDKRLHKRVFKRLEAISRT